MVYTRLLKNNFKASCVFLDLDKDHKNFEDNLVANWGFERVYKNEEGKIYEVKPR